MRPERRSQLLLGVTRSKAKMYEYDVPEEHHIKIKQDPAKLFTLAIGLLGDLSARVNSEDINEDYLKELRETLLFSARFFDAYLESRLSHEYDPYLLLLGAASYYLCNLPGSSLVLAKRLGEDYPDLECMGLEDLLLWLLQGDLSTYFNETEGLYGKYIDGISQGLTHFFKYGSGQESLFEKIANLRRTVYDNGTPRQLLFGDIICAVAKRRFENSTWHCLPQYSDLSTAQWMDTLQKETFIRELWPAQHLLGEHGIFRGKSAVVQMPTSAGKTKATEIIIRSAFLANRTSLAVIVAPFRALCHEIRNSFVEAFHNENISVDELSDVLQADFAIAEFLRRRQVLVVTPEKLIYVLRHTPELAENIGLLIYDEGHQFDSGTRGITYELLLTSLKTMVPEDAQTVLISAVIGNAPAVGKWINGEESEVVSGATLTPTYRTVAFASWIDLRGNAVPLGWLRFVNPNNVDEDEYFVPQIIEQQRLQHKGREYKERLFPEKTDGQAVALYLGLKLASNGSVAVFCGRKSTASTLCEKVVDAFDRGINLKEPTEFSDKEEVHRLHFLHKCNLGTNSIATKSAALGILSHHGNTPQGIRLAVEHAMKQGYAKFVICTSTLAQGVNLPIRYLIVTSVYQGTERIKVRDFHNLIGRAGRAGIHTEGSILFADPVVYDKRTSRDDKWRWEQVKELLDPSKSEPCVSTLLSIFEPLNSDDGKYSIKMEPLQIASMYVENPEELASLPSKLAASTTLKGKYTETSILEQISEKINIVSSIESYLMAHWDESDSGLNEEDVSELAKGTLAYFLSEEEQKEQIIELFKLLARNIGQNVADASRRTIYGKTLYGVRPSIEIEAWVTEHLDRLVLCVGHDDLLATLWPIIAKNIQNNTFRKCDQPEILKDVALGWINGKPYHGLFNILSDANVRLIAGTQRRQFKLEHIVEICENAFAYDGTLVLGAVAELIELVRQEDCAEIVSKIQELQKRLKYGLPFSSEIILYEIGFSDRVVSQDLGAVIDVIPSHRQVLVQAIKQHEKVIRETLRKYPSYFQMVLESIVG